MARVVGGTTEDEPLSGALELERVPAAQVVGGTTEAEPLSEAFELERVPVLVCVEDWGLELEIVCDDSAMVDV